MIKANLSSETSAIIRDEAPAAIYACRNFPGEINRPRRLQSSAIRCRPAILLVLGLALFHCVSAALAQPALSVVPTNRQVLLFWQSNYTGYTLQSCTNMSGTNWLMATDAAPSSYGTQIAFTVSNRTQTRYFRLYNTTPPRLHPREWP